MRIPDRAEDMRNYKKVPRNATEGSGCGVEEKVKQKEKEEVLEICTYFLGFVRGLYFSGSLQCRGNVVHVSFEGQELLDFSGGSFVSQSLESGFASRGLECHELVAGSEDGRSLSPSHVELLTER